MFYIHLAMYIYIYIERERDMYRYRYRYTYVCIYIYICIRIMFSTHPDLPVALPQVAVGPELVRGHALRGPAEEHRLAHTLGGTACLTLLV